MNKLFLVVFAHKSSRDGGVADQRFELGEDGTFHPFEVALAHGDEHLPVLVLPVSCGLPFRINVPFAEPDKVARVLPSLLGDLFANMKPDWRISWELETSIGSDVSVSPSPGSGKTVAAGFVFPSDAWRSSPCEDEPWRLVIADAMLFRKRENETCVKFRAPDSSGILFFSDHGRLDRVFVDNRGLVPPPCANTNIRDLFSEGRDVFSILSRHLVEPKKSDLSGWQTFRHDRIMRAAKVSIPIAMIGLILLYNSFLWLECHTLQERRDFLRIATAKAFEKTFPGVHAVEPLTQSRTLLKTLQDRAIESAPPADLDAEKLLVECIENASTSLHLDGIFATGVSWRLQGMVSNYEALEAFKARCMGSSILCSGKITESHVVQTASGGIRFTLEGGFSR
ncbi:MAG: hypothetical protein HQM09_01825 [Candidatus Riflebacteria bacterium]|nr:hypothetical protein [Candidatus Riflebacteria bacterium]